MTLALVRGGPHLSESSDFRAILRFTRITRSANHAPFLAGVQSAASLSDSCDRFTGRPATVWLSRSLAKAWRSDGANPLSWTTARATMCSLSVSAFPLASTAKRSHV